MGISMNEGFGVILEKAHWRVLYNVSKKSVDCKVYFKIFSITDSGSVVGRASDY